MKSTKIVCTIGPASQDEKIMQKLAEAGMDIARLNMSHGSCDFHKTTIDNIRKVSETTGKFIGILLDLQGPKIRTGKQSKEVIELKKGASLKLTTEDIIGDWEMLSINYNPLPEEAKPGEKILLDDGNIELTIKNIENRIITCEVRNGGMIRSFRGINLPDTPLSTPALTGKDLEDLDFGIKNNVDFIALSFVRQAEDIIGLRKKIEAKGKNIFIISKIEKPEAITNIDHIIEESDGIMVARGDLGAETSAQDVPILQKQIIRKCNVAHKPVITATQMMESMISKPKPTRAEANDVANAIFDGTDAVMLSGETAMGEYPVETVTVMTSIAERTEKEINYNELTEKLYNLSGDPGDTGDAVCYSACTLCNTINPEYMVGFSKSGRTIESLSKYRPSKPILGMSPDESVLRRLTIFRGVYGIKIEMADSSDELFDHADKILRSKGFCSPEEKVVAVSSMPLTGQNRTNMIKIHTVT
ncbi:MAG: pyruvate kinase [Spirochaetales bacterium]|nr:pyruvate kinase [Spirochaetales bacterium]